MEIETEATLMALYRDAIAELRVANEALKAARRETEAALRERDESQRIARGYEQENDRLLTKLQTIREGTSRKKRW